MRIGARDCWGEDVMGLLKITMYGLCTWNMVEVNPLKSMVGPGWRSILDIS